MSTRRRFLIESVGASAALLAPGFSGAATMYDASHLAPASSLLESGPTGSPHARSVPALECFDYRNVRILPGRMQRQIDLAYELYLNIPNDDILKGFREQAGMPAPGQGLGGWARITSGATLGQWLSGMARLSCAMNDAPMRAKAIALAEGWAATLGPASDPKMGTYQFEKMICGLVDLHLYAGHTGAMLLLERTTVQAMKNLDRTRNTATPRNRAGRTLDRADSANWQQHATNEWYTLSENSFRAYLVSGNPLFLEFAKLWLYPAFWDKFENSKRCNEFAYCHAYSHVNSLNGAAMAYVVLGDPRYLRIVENAFDWIQETQCYCTGGYGPAEMIVPDDGTLGSSLEKRTDMAEIPCGSWAAFKLSRYLMTYTKNARYGDWIENLFYNGIGAALPVKADGTSFYYGDYRLDSASKSYYWNEWPCCSGTYIQDIADYYNIIYYKDDKGLFVNLLVPSEVDFDYEGHRITVRQDTNFPESDESSLKVSCDVPVRFALRVRVPKWCANATFMINGETVQVESKPASWATIERTWAPEDQVTVKFPSSLYLVPVDRQHPRRAAVKFGPLVLVQQWEHFGERLAGVPGGPALPLVLHGGDPSSRLVREGDSLHFRVRPDTSTSSAGPLASYPTESFRPYYETTERTPYRMYFDLDALPTLL